MKKEGQENMNAELIPRPKGKEEDRSLVQAKVDMKLSEAVETERRKKGVKLREIVEWGMATWLAQENPKAAEKLDLLKKK